MRQIQEQLQAASRPDLATLLRGVQDHERSKLQYTMNLQVWSADCGGHQAAIMGLFDAKAAWS